MTRLATAAAVVLAALTALIIAAAPADAATTSGGCWPSAIGSGNYLSATKYPVYVNGVRYDQYHLNMTHTSAYRETAILISGVKVSSGQEVYVNRTPGVRPIRGQWDYFAADGTIRYYCGFNL